MFDKLKLEELLKGGKKVKLITIIGITGILLISLSVIIPSSKSTRDENTSESMTTKQYEEQLEEKIGKLVSEIEGVGNSKVIITLENGVENIYANTEKKSTNNTSGSSSGQNTKKNDTEQEVVIVDGKNGKEALMVTQKEPTVKGVVVVCDGADSIKTEQMIKDAITKSLNIKSNRVSVVKFANKQNN